MNELSYLENLTQATTSHLKETYTLSNTMENHPLTQISSHADATSPKMCRYSLTTVHIIWVPTETIRTYLNAYTPRNNFYKVYTNMTMVLHALNERKTGSG